MGIRKERGFPQQLEKSLAKDARLFHSSHRPNNKDLSIMYCRQRSTLRRPDFGPKDGEHLSLPEHGRELPEADHLYMSVIEWRPDRQVDFLVGGMAEEKASADATCCRSQGRLASVSFEYTNRTEKTIARRSRGRFFS